LKILVFGSSGMIGADLVNELLERGHSVTGVTRRRESRPDRRGLTSRVGDITDPLAAATLAKEHDAVFSAVRPAPDEGPDRVVDAARSLVDALPKAGVNRLIVVGGAGGLEVTPGVRVVDDPDFDPAYRSFSLAHVRALSLYQESDAALRWTMVCCPRVIEPGERTGHYRSGRDQLLVDPDGRSRITTADFAVAYVDELERPSSVRSRMTVAY